MCCAVIRYGAVAIVMKFAIRNSCKLHHTIICVRYNIGHLKGVVDDNLMRQ